VELPRFRGRLAGWSVVLGDGPPFEVDGREVAEGGVPPAWIVEAIDEAEHGHASLRLGGEAPPLKKLALEGREERLGQGVDAPMSVKGRLGVRLGVAG
jgi:hypothetical protein